MVLMKYKPTYVVTVSGERMGYVADKTRFEESIQTDILEYTGKNVESISLNETPDYELKLIDRQESTNEEDIIIALQKEATITYKFYEIALNGETKTYVSTEEEANQVVKEIEEKYKDEDIEVNLETNEIITQNAEEVKDTVSVELAEADIQPELDELVEIENSVPKINGIKLAVTPVSGSISSRYGVSSRIRSSTHTGLDIACSKGTPIKVVADGTVTSASWGGAYGNLVKVNHGNGVETWYAHCNEFYCKAGQKVSAGDVIAAVGTTGNSTGPHLHLEIRINGNHVNPQNYLYN